MSSTADQFGLSGAFLVTGGTRGIGRAISLQFARAGARVVAVYARNEKAAIELKAIAEQQGVSIDTLRADITTPDGLSKIEAHLTESGVPLAGLVHSAATGTHRDIASLTVRHLDFTFAVNVRAFFELVVRLQARLERGATLLAISSLGATRAVPKYTVIGSSKGALEAMVRHLAVELGPRGIRANLLAPGAVATEIWKAVPDAEVVLAETIRRSPFGRLITPEEVAQSAQFLCSPAAAGISGQTLVVDGASSIVF